MVSPSTSGGAHAGRGAAVFITPSAAYRIDDYVDAARRLGVEMVIATEAHHSLAEDMGVSIIPIDFDEPADAALRIAAIGHDIKAVIPLDDRGVVIAAQAAQLRGLPHNPAPAATATRDKANLRRQLAGKVSSPAWRVLRAEDDPIPAIREVGLPAVAKPLHLNGSAGVIRFDHLSHAAQTVQRVRSIATAAGAPPGSPLLLESFVDGAEISVEGLVTGGRWETLAVFDKPDPLPGPFFAETFYVTPSRHPPPLLEQSEKIVAQAIEILGITQGPVHAELRLGDHPVLLELAARPIGGLCGRALRFGLADTPLEDLIIRNALGEQVRGTRRAPGASGVYMIPVPHQGVFHGIDGVEQARSVPHITAIEVSRLHGQPVAPLPEESTYLGFVFARAPTPDQVEEALRRAVTQLKVSITP